MTFHTARQSMLECIPMTTETQATIEQQIWDLGDLYQGLDDPCLEADQERLENQLQAFENQFGHRLEQVISDPDSLSAALDAFAGVYALLYDLMTYTTLEWNVATQDPAINSFRDQTGRKISEWGNRLESFRQTLAHLPVDQLERLLEHPGVARYQAFLQQTRREQPYLLSEPEERLMAQLRPYSRQRWNDFYTQTTSTWLFNVDGEDMTESQAMSLLRRTDPELRQRANQSVLTKYGSQGDFISYIYNTLIQEHAQEARLRGFASTLAMQTHAQELIPTQVLNLVEEVRLRLPLFQRYYSVLKQSLGLDTLAWCDLSAPLRAEDWQIDWNQGRQLLLEALSPLGAELTHKVSQFFDKRWIHAEPMQGKASGAFCAPSSREHPYVLMNWDNNLYSLTVLAHELGHGLHFYETVSSQHVLHLMPPLFLAETASTLNEYFLAHHLISQTADREEKRYFLSDLLQRFMNGLFRQTQITAFEIFVHDEGSQRQLTATELNEKWFALTRESAGEALHVDEIESAAWSRIPHLFMYPFYCYNYTLSNLIVLALIHQYHQDAESFLPRYRQFLSSGGAAAPSELLALLGLDLNSDRFYEAAFAVLTDLIEQLEALSSSAADQIMPQTSHLTSTQSTQSK